MARSRGLEEDRVIVTFLGHAYKSLYRERVVDEEIVPNANPGPVHPRPPAATRAVNPLGAPR